MYLMMNNHEVRPQRITCPPAEVLESTCQLFSLPFRHEKGSGIFAVHPPLLGKSILIQSVRPARLADSRLYAQFTSELRLLERMLWVSGAEVVLRESLYPEGPTRQGRGPEHSSHWDLVLLVFAGQSVTGCVHPLAIYPWWQWARASYRLAGHFAADLGPSCPAFTRASSFRMTRDVKGWFSEILQETRAPTVLLSIPLIDGYVDQFLDIVSLVICRGVLRYFRKQPLPNGAWEIVRKAGSQPHERVGPPVSAVVEGPSEPAALMERPYPEIPAPASSPYAVPPPVTVTGPLSASFAPVSPVPASPAAAGSVSTSSTSASESVPTVPDGARDISNEPPLGPGTPEQMARDGASSLELARADLVRRRRSISLAAQALDPPGPPSAERPATQKLPATVEQPSTPEQQAAPEPPATAERLPAVERAALSEQPATQERPAAAERTAAERLAAERLAAERPVAERSPVRQLLQLAVQYRGQQPGQAGNLPARHFTAPGIQPEARTRQSPAQTAARAPAPDGLATTGSTRPLTINLPRSQREDERLMQLREILLKSPETAVKQAADVLSKRGIKPTPERIEEYIQYLNRMLFGQDTPKDNQPD